MKKSSFQAYKIDRASSKLQNLTLGFEYLKMVLKHRSTDPQRFILNLVSVFTKDDVRFICATDGRRLALLRNPVLAAEMEDGLYEVIHVKRNEILLGKSDCDAKFPDIFQVIPKEVKLIAKVRQEDIYECALLAGCRVNYKFTQDCINPLFHEKIEVYSECRADRYYLHPCLIQHGDCQIVIMPIRYTDGEVWGKEARAMYKELNPNEG
jgi:hypothetical protein